MYVSYILNIYCIHISGASAESSDEKEAESSCGSVAVFAERACARPPNHLL